MTVRREAGCRCGRLRALCEGEPVRVSVCHCLACQQRTGSAFAAQARFPEDKVTITGESRVWSRTADSGRTIDYHFCPTCGATVFYSGGNFPNLLAIPLGAFADPGFPPPQFSVWEKRKHPWTAVLGDEVRHSD
ncbi:GFA family protein [Brevundimonas sp.]|uniref:GFA family protein n=1 Tax=Brevundimonas sp. TaxID=1871086 RepID=UPI0035B043A1